MSPKKYNGLADGRHYVEVRGRDAWGRADPRPARKDFTVDTIRPETALSPGPDTPATSTAFTFSSEPTATFECRLNEGAWTPCLSGKAFVGLPSDQYRFEVRAVDRAGNRDATPASRIFTIANGVTDSVNWAGDFESGDLSQWATKQALPWGASLVGTPVRNGRHSARFEVRPGDDPINAKGERAELATRVADGGGFEGRETWYGWSTYFPRASTPRWARA